MGANRIPTREDDDRLLCWMYWRDEGWTLGQIAEHAGISRSAVGGATHRVDVAMREFDDE